MNQNMNKPADEIRAMADEFDDECRPLVLAIADELDKLGTTQRPERKRHFFDEEGCCMYCGFDGAEAHHLEQVMRWQIGHGEYEYRRRQGEFDADIYCEARRELSGTD